MLNKLKNWLFASTRPWLAAMALLLLAPAARAEDIKIEENRFLFIIDTASAMRKMSGTIVQDVVDLMQSDLMGELRKGDTIGLWTFDDSLHTDYPMQVWSKDDKSTITTELAAFLRGRKFEGRAHLEKVGPALNQVVKNSQRVTVLLISSGSEPIHGTPFDKDINDLQKKYARELRAAHKPFILVLAAHDGLIFDYTINYPGLVTIPHTAFDEPAPAPPPPAPVAVTPPPVTNEPPKLKIGPSIILSGPSAKKPVVAPEPVLALAPQNAPVTAVTNPAPAPVVATPPPVVQPAPVPAPQPAVVQTPPVTAPKPAIAPTVATPAPAPITPPPRPVVATPPPAAPVVKTAPAPASNATVNYSAPAPKASATTAPTAKPPLVNPAPLAQPMAAAAVPASGGSSTMFGLIAAGFLLLAIAVVVVIVMSRRSHRPPQSSLISQSINRPH